MDLFDKIGNIAKNIGDRTNDAIEITKLNAKIATEKSAVAEDLKKIGEFYYKKFADEEPIDTEIQEFCDNAASHYEAIDQAQAERKRRKQGVFRTGRAEQRRRGKGRGRSLRKRAGTGIYGRMPQLSGCKSGGAEVLYAMRFFP